METIVCELLRATFEQRSTKIPREGPTALSSSYTEDIESQALWQGFLHRNPVLDPLRSQKQKQSQKFVLPPANATADGEEFDLSCEAVKRCQAR